MDFSFGMNGGPSTSLNMDHGNPYGLVGLGGFRAGMILLDSEHVVLHLRSSGPRVSRPEMRKWMVIFAKFAYVSSPHPSRR